ncbi:MAG: hypothetical protein ACO27O_01875 [Hylemonella sp.]
MNFSRLPKSSRAVVLTPPTVDGRDQTGIDRSSRSETAKDGVQNSRHAAQPEKAAPRTARVLNTIPNGSGLRHGLIG